MTLDKAIFYLLQDDWIVGKLGEHKSMTKELWKEHLMKGVFENE